MPIEFSKPYIQAHPSRFVKLRGFVERNIGEKTSKLIEDALDEISDINNQVNKKNLSILFERVGILPNP